MVPAQASSSRVPPRSSITRCTQPHARRFYAPGGPAGLFIQASPRTQEEHVPQRHEDCAVAGRLEFSSSITVSWDRSHWSTMSLGGTWLWWNPK